MARRAKLKLLKHTIDTETIHEWAVDCLEGARLALERTDMDLPMTNFYRGRVAVYREIIAAAEADTE